MPDPMPAIIDAMLPDETLTPLPVDPLATPCNVARSAIVVPVLVFDRTTVVPLLMFPISPCPRIAPAVSAVNVRVAEDQIPKIDPEVIAVGVAPLTMPPSSTSTAELP